MTATASGVAAEPTVRASCESAAVGGPAPRALLVLGPGAGDPGPVGPGVTVLSVTCTGDPDPLVPVRQLVAALLPVLRAEAPELADRYAPELAAIAPGAVEPPPERRLDRMANTPSERRSHRESEVLFRMANGISALLAEAMDTCPSLAGPVLVSFSGLERADTATLLTFRRLSRWAVSAPGRLVVAGRLDPAAPAGPVVPDPALPAEVAGLFGHREAWAASAQAVREQFGGVVTTAGPAGGDRAGPVGPAGDPGPRPVTDALAALAAGDAERGCVLAVRAMAGAAIALDFGTVLLLAGHVLATAGGGLDHARFEELWDASPAAPGPGALEFSTVRPLSTDDLRGTAWKAAGFANSCLQEHERALRCYTEALAVAGTPPRRAQARMYLALVAGKRLRRAEEAAGHLDAGFAEIEGLDDAEALLERGWLLNVAALMAVQAKRFGEAGRRVKEARRLMRPLHSTEATHLKVNLVSNVSTLLELSGDVPRSIEIWRFFEAFLASANELFAKHYHFREGGLLTRLGEHAAAAGSYAASHEQAVAVNDPFHARYAAEACGWLAARQDDFAAAAGWYEWAVEHALRAGDHQGVPDLLAALGGTRLLAGDPAGAALALDRAEAAAAALDRAGTRAEARPADLVDDARTAGAGGSVAAARRRLAADPMAWRDGLPMPRSKLNRPFTLVNPYLSDPAD